MNFNVNNLYSFDKNNIDKLQEAYDELSKDTEQVNMHKLPINIEYGIKFGANMSHPYLLGWSEKSYSKEYTQLFGLMLSGLLMFEIYGNSDIINLDFGFEILYTQKGMERIDDDAKDDDNYRMIYICIPILFRIRFFNFLYSSIGPYLGSPLNTGNPDLGLTLRFGSNINLNKRKKIPIEIGIDLGFIDTSHDEYPLYQFCLYIQAGYTIWN